MQALTKGLVAGAVGLLVLVPAGIAIADDDDDSRPHDPVCTEDQRHDHWQLQDRMHDAVHVVVEESCPGTGPGPADHRADDNRPGMPNDNRPGMHVDDTPGMHDGRVDDARGPVGEHQRMGR